MEKVAAGITLPVYNTIAPFHPDTHFPELPFKETSDQLNYPYALLRNLLFQLGYDKDNFGTSKWNPLKWLVQPEQTVLLKPNYVISYNSCGDDLFAVVTHPSILRALIDYVYLALQGKGRIIIADAPQIDCDWQELMSYQHLETIQTFYRTHFNFEIEAYDLRNYALIDSRKQALAGNRKNLNGDPLGSCIVNLGDKSEFYGLPNENYYGADYNRSETIAHHRGTTQEYSVSKTILSADVLISVPKMKVHKKVGVTLNLKGLVGINTNKNYLVHYRVGTPSEGGDQLPDTIKRGNRWLIKTQRWFFDHALARQNALGDKVYNMALGVYRTFVKPFYHIASSTSVQDSGNWHGNDSAWRMTADLCKILYFADANGILHDTPQRKLFCVIDGIIGGENEGPLSPNAKRSGCLVMGEDPLAVDMVTTTLMGFNVDRIKQFSFLKATSWPFPIKSLSNVEVFLHHRWLSGKEFIEQYHTNPLLGYRAHPGWIGQIELSQHPYSSKIVEFS